MNLSEPLLDVTPGVRGSLLQVLARLERPVTRRELAALADVAPSHATTVVQSLVDAGLVDEMIAGRASMVALNRSHLASGQVLALANLRGELIRRLRERLADWPDLRGAWLFGSVARGDAAGDSDIDVLIVVDDPQSADFHDRLSTLHAEVRSWTGNDLQFVEHSKASWRALVRERNPLVEQVRLDGIALTEDSRALLGRVR